MPKAHSAAIAPTPHTSSASEAAPPAHRSGDHQSLSPPAAFASGSTLHKSAPSRTEFFPS